MNLTLPAWILLVWICASIIVTARIHGQVRRENVYAYCALVAGQVALLWWGGFFDPPR